MTHNKNRSRGAWRNAVAELERSFGVLARIQYDAPWKQGRR